MQRVRSLAASVAASTLTAMTLAASILVAPAAEPALAAAPTLARPAQCFASERVLTRLDALKAHHAVYEGEAVRRAAMIYAATPPLGALPRADRLIVADMPTGSVALLFLRGTTICATMMIADSHVAARARQFILGIEV